jgi:hypothetical protein
MSKETSKTENRPEYPNPSTAAAAYRPGMRKLTTRSAKSSVGPLLPQDNTPIPTEIPTPARGLCIQMNKITPTNRRNSIAEELQGGRVDELSNEVYKNCADILINHFHHIIGAMSS